VSTAHGDASVAGSDPPNGTATPEPLRDPGALLLNWNEQASSGAPASARPVLHANRGDGLLDPAQRCIRRFSADRMMASALAPSSAAPLTIFSASAAE